MGAEREAPAVIGVPLPARAFAVLSGTIRRTLGLPSDRPDSDAIVELGKQVQTLARWHRVRGFLEADPYARAFLEVPGGHKDPARSSAIVRLVELSRILGRLRSAGVPAIPLKGPLLSERLYGDATLRGAHDVDLLVQRERIDDTIAALGPEYLISGWSRRTREACEHHEVLHSNVTGRIVELHWQLLNPQSGLVASATALWESTSLRTHAGISHLSLDPAVEAVFVGVHAAHHSGCRLHWLSDVAALSLQLDATTWEDALDLAARWRVRTALLTAVEAAGLALDVPLPAVLERASRKNAAHRSASWIARRLKAGIAKLPSQFEAWPHRYAMLDDWRSRIRVTARLGFTPIPDDRVASGLPNWADPLTGAMRPFFVLLRALKPPRT
jgi:Uncharacterised nucleotidyltransferase